MPASHVSIRQLAQLLGLAPSTVSMALNDAPTIADATRKRVQAEARRQGWRPNPMASALFSPRRERSSATARTAVAFLTDKAPHVRGFPGDDIWEGVTREAERLGCVVEYCNLHGANSARPLLRALFARGFSGLIFGGINRPEIFDAAQLAKFHLVSVQTRTVDVKALTIRLDAGEAVRICWRRLAEQGCRRIGCCLWDHHGLTLDDQRRLEALLYCQHREAKSHQILPPFTLDQHTPQKEFGRYLRRHRPDGLIGFSGLQAWFLNQPGVRNPELRAYAQLNVLPIEPPCQGISMRSEQKGAAAVRVLQRMIRLGEPTVIDVAESWVLESEWVNGPPLPAPVTVSATAS